MEGRADEAGAKTLRLNCLGNHAHLVGPEEKVQEAERRARGARGVDGDRRPEGAPDRAWARPGTPDPRLPRLRAPLCQLGAAVGAQHPQPRGRTVHERGGHSVGRGRGAGGWWLPHVVGEEEVRHRYPTPPGAPEAQGRRRALAARAGGGPRQGRVETETGVGLGRRERAATPTPGSGWRKPGRVSGS